MLFAIKLFCWGIGIFATLTVFRDVLRNFNDLLKKNPKNFSGKQAETVANITAITLDIDPQTRWQIRLIALSYEIDGVVYDREVELLETGKLLKEGDSVVLFYDSADPENIFMPYEIESAKNGLKLDVGYFVIILILGLIMFFVVFGQL